MRRVKPGLIVDGQQRAAAIREARIDSFPICATAFIANDDREQREQFILVNSTKPLPKGSHLRTIADNGNEVAGPPAEKALSRTIARTPEFRQRISSQGQDSNPDDSFWRSAGQQHI